MMKVTTITLEVDNGKTKQKFSYLSQGKKINPLYQTYARLVKGDAIVVENENSTELWYKRLGHMSEKRL
jgi:hypothetical protein